MKYYVGLLSVGLLLLSGCRTQPCVGATCQVKNCIPQCAAKKPDLQCAPLKCIAEVRDPKVIDAKCVQIQAQIKDAYVMERKAVTTKVPVQTFRVVDEWVDAPVLEQYSEKVKVRMPRKMNVADEQFKYEEKVGMIDVKLNVPNTTIKSEQKCQAVRISDKIVRYDECGFKEYLPITRVGEQVVHRCQKNTENAVYTLSIPGYVEVPKIAETPQLRKGYYTEEFAVQKYREVPGKVLQKRRICETVWVDKVEYEEVARPVKRTINLPVEKDHKKVVYEKKEVEVDCQTGARLKEVSKDAGKEIVKAK